MATQALIFMLTAWTVVLGITVWCYARLLRGGGKKDEGAAPPDEKK
jgi:hypothetical protein